MDGILESTTNGLSKVCAVCRSKAFLKIAADAVKSFIALKIIRNNIGRFIRVDANLTR
jgi:hypothetical protein